MTTNGVFHGCNVDEQVIVRMASVLLLLVTSLTNVLANNCCRQQMVTGFDKESFLFARTTFPHQTEPRCFSGSISLDGVYTLVEERPFIDLAPRDRDICQVQIKGERKIPTMNNIHEFQRVVVCTQDQDRRVTRNTVLQVVLPFHQAFC